MTAPQCGFTWSKGDCNSGEVVVTTPGLEREGCEPLNRYLPRASENALARAPLELELPAFPWPFPDLLSKSTPNVKGAGPVEALGQSNLSSTVQKMTQVPPPHLDPPNMAGSPVLMTRSGPPGSITHQLGSGRLPHQQVGRSVAGPSLSAVLPINPSQARCMPRQASMIVSGASVTQAMPTLHTAGYPRRP